MDENNSRHFGWRLIPVPPRAAEGRIQYLLTAEVQILQSISARAPLPQILNEICTALDCQIGNMVSFISLPQDKSASVAEIARNAALFGLYIFFSTGVFAGSGEELGSLEMYCCTPRDPSCFEVQLVERAACLAAIAMECGSNAGHHANRRLPENGPTSRSVLRLPVSMN
ncbi:MAG: hypothetical protein WB543_02950 [Candidatus Acidiferrum sp.]